MDLKEEKRIDKVRRMEKYLKDLMSEGYIVSSGRYFLTEGLEQYKLLSDDNKLEIFAEGSKWIVNHEHKIVTVCES